MDEQLRNRILPVIDLKGSLVVRGIAGRREEYQAVQSVLTATASPTAVASALRDNLGFRDVYIADLDAIAGASPSWDDYQSIMATGLRAWIDAGAGDMARINELAESRLAGDLIHRMIIGLESVYDLAMLARMVQAVDVSRLVFSLDMLDGRPLSKCAEWKDASAMDIAEDVKRLGIDQFIVLDLARVGVGQGTGTEDLCRQINNRWPEIELIGGGGVRTSDDVERLCHSGLSRVLVASALHDGSIS